MVFVPGDGGGSRDTLSVDTEALRTVAPSYFHVGQQVNTLQQNLQNIVQLASGDMFLLIECAKMASMLEQLQERIGIAMQCASVGLSRISVSLEIAAELYTENEKNIGSAFTRIEDDTHPWNIPTIASTVKPGDISPTLPIQQPQPTPGTNPQKPIVQPEPVINPFILPDTLL